MKSKHIELEESMKDYFKCSFVGNRCFILLSLLLIGFYLRVVICHIIITFFILWRQSFKLNIKCYWNPEIHILWLSAKECIGIDPVFSAWCLPKLLMEVAWKNKSFINFEVRTRICSTVSMTSMVVCLCMHIYYGPMYRYRDII